ncbi:MAG: acylphosphatase [Spirochaetes bacterium]|nr:acylphosphatase [Spirochaetota bacterium]
MVGFRYFTVRLAERYGVTGRVRNLYDGRVEIEAEGNKAALSMFLEDIRMGPRSGRVDNVVEQWAEIPVPRYNEFGVSF